MRNLFALLIVLVQITVHAATPSDPELLRLTSALDQAKSQKDMNVASTKLCEFWDAKLLLMEKRVAGRLGGREQKRFAASKTRWREYRSREVAFRTEFFHGGSIQPLMANCAYSEITTHRISELESLFADALNQRAEPTGPANGSQPTHSETNRTSSAVGSRR